MRQTTLTVLAVLVWLCVTGCSSTPSGNTTGVGGADDSWIDNPSSISGCLAAVGSSPVLSDYDVSGARDSAEVNGRAKLAAMMKARIQAYNENWSKRCADLCDEDKFMAYMNDEAEIRQLVNLSIRGAQAVRYRQVGKTVYCLMALRDVDSFFRDVVEGAGDRLAKDEVLLKTEALKAKARKKLESMIEEERKQLKKDQHDIFKQMRSHGREGES